jgi:hypothetical protein
MQLRYRFRLGHHRADLHHAVSVATRLAILLVLSSCCASAQQDFFVPAIWGAIVGVPYRADLAPQKGSSIERTQGELPPGLTLAASGAITGTPITSGQYAFTVETLARGKRLSRKYLLIVSPQDAMYGPRPGLTTSSGKALRSCQREPLSAGNYVLAADISGDEASVCFFLARGTHLDLGGFNVNGRLNVTGNPAGVEISHGSVECRWKDDGGNAGCIHVNGDGPAAEPLIIHDLTIANAAEDGRGLHIDWPAAGLAGKPTIILERLRVDVPTQPTVSRAYAVSIIAKNQFVLASSNDLQCSGTARACQALMCYGVGQCKVHHNRIVMEQNTTDENGRAILFDGHTQFGEAWNNDVVVNNNRGIRIRDSRNIRVHHNTFSSITPEQNALAVLHIGDPDIKEPNDLQSSVDENRFLSKGGAILFARGATNFRFANNSVECSPKCPPYSLAQVRGPIHSDLVFWHNKLVNVDEPAISLGPNTKVLLCDSGQAGGEGVVEEKCSSRPAAPKTVTTERK